MRNEPLVPVLLACATLALWTSACGDDTADTPLDSAAPSTEQPESDTTVPETGDSDTTGTTTDDTSDTDGPSDNSHSPGETTGDPCLNVDCSGLDSDCATGVCNPASGECTTVAMNNDSPCDTADACSTGVCIGGTCEATPIDCSNLNGPCVQGSCNPDTGTCESTPAQEGEACDDGNSCTVSTCSEGTCSGPPLDCSDLDDDCNQGTCNPDTGTCEETPANDGDACEDGDACTLSVCAAGVCAGPPVDCSDLDDDCNQGTCNPESGACQASPTNEGDECRDDELQCLAGTCEAGACIDTAPVDCTALASECTIGICFNETGECDAAPVNDGDPCDDEDPCTTGTTCTDGVCSGGSPTDC